MINIRSADLRARWERLEEAAPSIPFAVRVAALRGACYLLRRWVWLASNLPEQAYEQPVIALALLQRVAVHWWGWLLLPVLFIFRHRLIDGWTALEHGAGLRIVTGAVVVISAWTYATYDYNLYFDQGHVFDRTLLIGLAALTFWRPIVLLPFALVLKAIINQFEYPIVGSFRWPEMDLILLVMVLFVAVFLISRSRTRDFLFLLCCLVASGYFFSGLGKVQLNWLAHPHIDLSLLGGYSIGWLGFLTHDAVVALWRIFARVSLPLMLFTFMLELGSVFILARKFTLPILLVCYIAFHMGVFAITGIFFWKWIVLEAAMLAFLYRLRRRSQSSTLSIGRFALSVAIIAGGVVWFKPTNLSWYETPLQYAYWLEGVGQSGSHYELTAATFAPYADAFAFDNLGFLSPAPQLTNPYGVTANTQVASLLVNTTTPDQVFALERTLGDVPANATPTAQFDRFITHFLSHMNQHGRAHLWFSAIPAPPHIWSLARTANIFSGQERLTKVIVYQVTTLFDGQKLDTIRVKPIHEVDIPTDAAVN